MPKRKSNRTPQENEAISDKVDELLSEGISIERATAAAFRMYRDGELTIPRRVSQEYVRTRTRKRTSLIQGIAYASRLLGLDELLSNQKKGK